MMNPLAISKGKALVFLSLLCLFIVQGCRKDIIQPNSGILNNSLSIAEAKAYFDANLRQGTKPEKLMSTSVIKSITLEDVFNSKQPIWESAYSKMQSSGGVVKIPLDLGSTYSIVNKKTGAVVPFGSLNYLMMYRDSLEKIHAEWVYLQPDSAWLYGNRSSYSGSITVKTWDGQLIKKLSYNKAGVPSLVNAVKSSQLSSNGTPTKTAVNEALDVIVEPYCVTLQYNVQKKCTCTANRLATLGCDRCDQCMGIRWQQFCAWPEPPVCTLCDIPPSGGSGSSTGGGTSGGSGNIGGAGGANDGNYPPNCNSDPNYVMPSYPAPPGYSWVMPCSGPDNVPIPVTPSTYSFKLDNIISFLGITDPDKQNFLLANNNIYDALVTYLVIHGDTPENKEFVDWAVGYLRVDASRFDQEFKNLLFEQDVFESEETINSGDNNLNLPVNPAIDFSSNNYNVIEINNFQSNPYSENHPVSKKIIAYNPWIYRALVGSNNTSVRHLHLISKGLAAGDGYRKGIGAIGEGLFAERVTTDYPTSPGGNMYVGQMVGGTHIDALQEHFLPKIGGSYYGLMVNYTDINGNPQHQKMQHPDLTHNTALEIGRIAYEVKTLNANKNSEENIYKAFLQGINQTIQRSKINGIDVGVLVFDSEAWRKLLNSNYKGSVLNKLNEISSLKNTANERIVYIRIEKNLWKDANSAYFDLLSKIKDLP